MLPSQKHQPTDAELPAILSLIRGSFAYMDDRIDPPSSMHRLTLSDVAKQCETGEVWSLGAPPVACMFLTYRPDCLYLGKLAVAVGHRGTGLARQLVDIACNSARSRGLPAIELQSRVELTEVHAAFTRCGFVKTGETAHPGYDRPTSITMRLNVT